MRDTDTLSALLTLITLQVTFIVLKLTNAVDWSWWVVLTPIWVVIFHCVIIWIVYVILDKVDGKE